MSNVHAAHCAKFGRQVEAAIASLSLADILAKLEQAEQRGGASAEFLDVAGMRCAAAAEGLRLLSDRLGEAAAAALDLVAHR